MRKQYEIEKKTVWDESSKMRESGDCTVKALALAAKIPYIEAHTALSLRGRKYRRGCSTAVQVVQAASDLGYKMEYIPNLIQPNGSRYTPKTIGRVLAKGRYIVRSQGHAFAVVNGNVLDWTNGRKHRILEAWKVTKLK